MGDIFSSKKNTTNNLTENHQVAVQGNDNISLSNSLIASKGSIAGSSFSAGGNVSVISYDPEATMEALRVASEVVNGSQQSVIAALQLVDISGDRANHQIEQFTQDQSNAAHVASAVGITDPEKPGYGKEIVTGLIVFVIGSLVVGYILHTNKV